MTYINQDTKKIYECGKQIVSLSEKFNTEINAFFNKAFDMKYHWKGEDAEKFLLGLKKEHKEYIDYGNILYKLGKELMQSSSEIDFLATETLK